MSIRRISGAVAGILVAGSAMCAPLAGADTHTESYPETPAVNAKLPIIHESHGSDHIKANVLNARPICNPWEDYRTVVYKVTDNFMPVGTISTTNQSQETIKLQQNLSKSQTLTLNVQGDRTNTTTMNAGYTKDGLSFGISHSIAEKLGVSASYSLSWQTGQTIGPYDVPANHTGEATYGFRALNMTGTQQYCKPNGTWSTPTFWAALQPLKNEVRVKLYDDVSDSFAPNKDAQNTTPVVDETEKDPQADAEVVKENEVPVTEEVASEAEANAEVEADKKVDEDVAAGETTEATEAAEVPAPADKPAADGQHKLDLQPYLTTSGAKRPGFAGTVALRVKNVGTDRYYGAFPATQFRIDVKTDKGPEGVDRLITPRSSHGAHIRDLGFDEKTSTRSFEVTLSNPIKAGESVRLANLDFGDGKTSEGRLYNYITITQTSRIQGDDSEYNDQDVDSRENTNNDFGKKHNGIF